MKRDEWNTARFWEEEKNNNTTKKNPEKIWKNIEGLWVKENYKEGLQRWILKDFERKRSKRKKD